jgi:soluble cytochrome b562
MKTGRYLILISAAALSLCAARDVSAQTNPSSTAPTPPPVSVPIGATDLGSVPANIKALLVSFDKARAQYLAQQNLLLIQLKHATTAAERQQIREELQENRQAFLDAQKALRQELSEELAALKGKISHEEFLRILDAAQNAATEGGTGHHKGH